MGGIASPTGREFEPEVAGLSAPLVDKALYRVVRLENGIRCVLVSDTEAEKAAASCDVRVGSLSDPDSMPGLAHFLEHMLFYKSKKYPVEDAYSKYIAERGGSTNAYTSSEQTNFHFCINAEGNGEGYEGEGVGDEGSTTEGGGEGGEGEGDEGSATRTSGTERGPSGPIAPQGALAGALDRFGQFFISPLISAEGVRREAEAVSSEHAKNLHSDAWRSMEVWKAVGRPSHPYNRFATGSLETLILAPEAAGIEPHAELRAFHLRHYSASLMTVAVIGRQSLDELQAMVEASFSGVADRELEPFRPSPDLWGDGREDAGDGEGDGEGSGGDSAPEGGAAAAPSAAAEGPRSPSYPTPLLILSPPIKDSHSLELRWCIPPERDSWECGPAGYWGHLLGHEGAGSLFASLQRRGWASRLVAGEGGAVLSTASQFVLRISLTDEGTAHVAEALEAVFAYLAAVDRGRGSGADAGEGDRALLRSGSPTPGSAPAPLPDRTLSLWEENRSLSEMRFRFSEKVPPFSYATSLASALQTYPPEHLLEAMHHVPRRFDAAKIRRLRECLRPEKVRVLWCSSRWDSGAERAADPTADGPAQREGAAETEGRAEPGAGTGAATPAPAEVAAARSPARAVPSLDLPSRWVTEPVYGTRYAVGPIPEPWTLRWSNPEALVAAWPELHLPKINPFIPRSFELIDVDGNDGEPASVADGEGVGGGSGEGRRGVPGEGHDPPRRRPPAPPALVRDPSLERTILNHKPDVSFSVPKASVYMRLMLPTAYATPRASVLTQAVAHLACDTLGEQAYDANLAGLHYGVRAAQCGMIVTVSGHAEPLPRLLDLVLRETLTGGSCPGAELGTAQPGIEGGEGGSGSDALRIGGVSVPPVAFEAVMDRLRKDYANADFDQPYERAMYLSGVALEEPRWSVDEYRRELASVTPRELAEHLVAVFAEPFAEVFAGGNIDRRGALEVARLVEGQLARAAARASRGAQGRRAHVPAGPLLPLAPHGGGEAWRLSCHGAYPRAVRLEEGTEGLLRRASGNPASANSAASVTIQVGGGDDPRTDALADLVAQIGSRDAFHQLRTVEQLGYITHMGCVRHARAKNLLFIVQSSIRDATYLRERILAFLPRLGARLEAMSPGELEGHVRELRKHKLEKPKRLSTQLLKDWCEIYTGARRFERAAEEAAELETVTIAELRAFYRRHVADPSTRRALTVLVQGAAAAIEEGGSAAVPGTVASEQAAEGAATPEPAAEGATTPEPAAEVAFATEPAASTVFEVTDIHTFRSWHGTYPSLPRPIATGT